MGNYRDEIERFIYEIYYQPMWTSISDYVSQHLSLLDLTYSRVKYPDSVYVEDMLLEFTKNIRINEDTLSFDAVVSCTMNLTEDSYRAACWSSTTDNSHIPYSIFTSSKFMYLITMTLSHFVNKHFLNPLALYLITQINHFS